MTNTTLFNRQLQEFSSAGWRIISQTQDSAQLEQPKRWDILTLLIGVVLLPAGIGVFIIGFVLARYALNSPNQVYLTADDVAAGNVPDFNEIGKFYYEKKEFWVGLGVVLILMIGSTFVLYLIATILATLSLR